MSESKKTKKATINEETVPPVTAGAKNENPDDLVELRLFKDNSRYKDDLFVAVNGRSFQIQRGVKVMIPRYVCEVIEQSEQQDAAAAELMNAHRREFESAAKKLGI